MLLNINLELNYFNRAAFNTILMSFNIKFLETFFFLGIENPESKKKNTNTNRNHGISCNLHNLYNIPETEKK